MNNDRNPVLRYLTIFNISINHSVDNSNTSGTIPVPSNKETGLRFVQQSQTFLHRSYIRIILFLHSEQLGIASSLPHQLLMLSALFNTVIGNKYHLIAQTCI